MGGVDGYKRFCKVINDPKPPDHKEMKEWVYGRCGYPEEQKWPDGVSADAINEVLHGVEYTELKTVKHKKKN